MAAASEETSQGNAAQDRLTAYDVIVAKYLFNPSRTEGRTEPTKPAVPLPPKRNLLGVVVDGSRSRAYLEDPSTKRVVAYQLGDSAGGTLERITDDRVQIARSDGLMEVMLRDPSKPTPAPPTPRPPTRGAAPVAPDAAGRSP